MRLRSGTLGFSELGRYVLECSLRGLLSIHVATGTTGQGRAPKAAWAGPCGLGVPLPSTLEVFFHSAKSEEPWLQSVPQVQPFSSLSSTMAVSIRSPAKRR